MKLEWPSDMPECCILTVSEWGAAQSIALRFQLGFAGRRCSNVTFLPKSNDASDVDLIARDSSLLIGKLLSIGVSPEDIEKSMAFQADPFASDTPGSLLGAVVAGICSAVDERSVGS